MKRQAISNFPLLIMGVFIVFASSCKKDNDNKSDNPTNGKTTAVFNSSITYGSMTDQDGNTYKTVTIGTQTWMAENLRTTKYNDGTDIYLVTDNTAWGSLTSGGYCNYANTTNVDTIATYGRLYNWYAVNTGKLAPNGWHVPTDAEWETLTNYLGGTSVVGGKLKEIGTTHWNSPNQGATNETGFTALPGGYRDEDGTFGYIGRFALLCSATENGLNSARSQFITEGGSNGVMINYRKVFGYSVRCVRD